MRKTIMLCLYLAIICLFAYSPASASYHFISDPNDPALAGITGINFDDQTLGQYTSLTIGNVTYTASLSQVALNTQSQNPGLYTYGPYFYISNDSTGVGPPYNTSGKYLNTGNGYPNNGIPSSTPGCDILTITFTNPVSAFGFSWGALDAEWTLAAYDSANYVLASYDLTTQIGFGGVANDDGLANIAKLVLTQYHNSWYTDAGDALFIDYVVPLPGAVWLLGSGLVGLAGWRRFRKS